MYSSIWINSAQPDAADIFSRNLRYLLNRVNPRGKPLAFACIGSANVPGDSLGPLMGTILIRHGLPNVYGTLEWPLNALTLPHNMPLLKTVEKKYCLIAIDAAIGNPAQSGHLTLTEGALFPGSALRRRLPPVGHLHITGVFDNLTHPSARTLLPAFCYPLTYAILSLQNKAAIFHRPALF